MDPYTKTHNELRKIFDPKLKEISIPGSKIKIQNLEFISDFPFNGFSNSSDTLISENFTFTYPVFVPEDKETGKVILLLHGLNERSWEKYLTWAFYLTTITGSYVILFPISFHINRSPASWKDPRSMIQSLQKRISLLGKIDKSSFANVALSERLTDDPLRFFSSGYQTSCDIIKLMLSIKDNKHPVIRSLSTLNIFAYSIGAFLAEILVLGNPNELFSGSKLFIFCGGSVFSNMKGTSKLIMDKVAFDRVYNYYMNDFENTIKDKSPLSNFLNYNQTGLVFRSMIDLGRLRLFRENLFRKLRGQIHSITLSKDTVIPSDGIRATLSDWDKSMQSVTDIVDFPYQYTHENPFPVLEIPLSLEVDKSFEKVFSAAGSFLI